MMQSGKKNMDYKNALDCTIKIFKSEGIKGFYKGGMCNIIRGIKY